MKLVQKYRNLSELLKQNPAARNYFNALPEYVQDTIRQRGDAVCCTRDLQGYAENLLRGDD